MKVSWNFTVCNKYFKERTLGLIGSFLTHGESSDHFRIYGSSTHVDNIFLDKVCDEDDYYSHVEKMIAAFRISHLNHNDCDWYFFGDDDTFVHWIKLRDFCKTLDSNLLTVFGCVIKHSSTNMEHVHGGSGFLMSRRTLNRIITKVIDQLPRKALYFDLYLVDLINEYNQNQNEEEMIRLQNIPWFYHSRYPFDLIPIDKCLSVHLKNYSVTQFDIWNKMRKHEKFLESSRQL